MPSKTPNMIFTEDYSRTISITIDGNISQVKWEKKTGDEVYAKLEGAADPSEYYVETEYGSYHSVPAECLMFL